MGGPAGSHDARSEVLAPHDAWHICLIQDTSRLVVHVGTHSLFDQGPRPTSKVHSNLSTSVRKNRTQACTWERKQSLKDQTGHLSAHARVQEGTTWPSMADGNMLKDLSPSESSSPAAYFRDY